MPQLGGPFYSPPRSAHPFIRSRFHPSLHTETRRTTATKENCHPCCYTLRKKKTAEGKPKGEKAVPTARTVIVQARIYIHKHRNKYIYTYTHIRIYGALQHVSPFLILICILPSPSFSYFILHILPPPPNFLQCFPYFRLLTRVIG